MWSRDVLGSRLQAKCFCPKEILDVGVLALSSRTVVFAQVWLQKWPQGRLKFSRGQR